MISNLFPIRNQITIFHVFERKVEVDNYVHNKQAVNYVVQNGFLHYFECQSNRKDYQRVEKKEKYKKIPYSLRYERKKEVKTKIEESTYQLDDHESTIRETQALSIRILLSQDGTQHLHGLFELSFAHQILVRGWTQGIPTFGLIVKQNF